MTRAACPGDHRAQDSCRERAIPVDAAIAPIHVEHSGDSVLPLPLAEAVPLFTPEGERAYVPGWEPEYLHPTEPSDAAGTVFRTRAEGEETLWLVLEHHPAAGVAARLEGWREAIVGLADRNPGR